MRGERCDARRAGARLLTSWWFIAALALWGFNDQVAKFRWPGFITGKASDLLGVVVLPLLLAAAALMAVGPVSRRTARRVGGVSVVAVAVAFGAVKASSAIAERVSDLWSSVLPNTFLSDRTDLVALAAAPLAWWIWRSTVDTAPVVGEPAELSLQAGRFRQLRRAPRVIVGLAVVVLGLAVTTATSCYDSGAVSSVFLGSDGRLYATGDSPNFAVSDDGAEWTVVEDPDVMLPEPSRSQDLVPRDEQYDPDAPAPWATRQEVCGATTCWSGLPGSSITERDLATGAEREITATGTSECAPTLTFGPMTVVNLDGQEVLVAGNARDGVIRVEPGQDPTYPRFDLGDPGGIDIFVVGMVVGMAVPVLLIIAAIVAVIVWARRRNR